MTRWGMVVDLGRCVGCQTCTIACKMENGLPPGTLWRTVLDLESGAFPDVRRQFFPLTCMHCADPPCHDACPTTATRVRPDGIVWIADDLCIGCGACVVACPYEARHLVPRAAYYFGQPTPPEQRTYNPARVGICTKCHFCSHKYDDAPADARPGLDPAYTPACVSSCIGNVIQFGDLDDPDSHVSRQLREHGGGTRLLEHLGTQPSVLHLNAPAIDPRPPRRQHTWHGLAVANFLCAPTGVGLYVLAVLAGWLEGPLAPLVNASAPLSALSALDALAPRHWAGLLAPLLVCIGLLAVGAEAGRPLRGFNVLRNLRRSWMSRESAFAMVFIALAALDTLFWQSPPVQALAVLAGLGAVLAQGIILSRAKGVPAWNVPIMPAHFLASALLYGYGALTVLLALHGEQPAWPGVWVGLGLALIAVDLAVWQGYLRTPPKTSTFQAAVTVLRRRDTQAGVLWAGHVLPAVFLLAGAVLPAALPAFLFAAGALLLAGALAARHAVIIKAAFLVDLFDRGGEFARHTASRTAGPAAPAAGAARAA